MESKAPSGANTAAAPVGGRILLESVGKIYDAGEAAVVAVEDVTLTVSSGEFLILLGPSGCGKTTLLRMIGGLENVTSGRLAVESGRRPHDTQAKAGEGISTAFQDPRLFPWMSVIENVTLPLRLQGTPAAERRTRGKDLCALVGLTGFENARPDALSGGMKQRASIARALSIDPSTLLLDEPFGALDAMTRDQMNLELQRLWMQAGATVVLVTHSILEAVFLGDRIVLLSPRPGRIHKVYDIPFARPRDIDVQSTPEFQAIVRDIRHELNSFKA